jgi:hypothetical protein
MRVSDLPRLLLLMRPVRCHVCLHRRYANVLLTLLHRDKPGEGTPRATAEK